MPALLRCGALASHTLSGGQEQLKGGRTTAGVHKRKQMGQAHWGVQAQQCWASSVNNLSIAWAQAACVQGGGTPAQQGQRPPPKHLLTAPPIFPSLFVPGAPLAVARTLHPAAAALQPPPSGPRGHALPCCCCCCYCMSLQQVARAGRRQSLPRPVLLLGLLSAPACAQSRCRGRAPPHTATPSPGLRHQGR